MSIREFKKILPNTFIYESIAIKVYRNANIMNTQIFHFIKYDFNGHWRSQNVTFMFILTLTYVLMDNFNFCPCFHFIFLFLTKEEEYQFEVKIKQANIYRLSHEKFMIELQKIFYNRSTNSAAFCAIQWIYLIQGSQPITIKGRGFSQSRNTYAP